MGFIDKVIRDVRDTVSSGKQLKQEDSFRRLAVNERKGYRLPIVYANNEYFLTKTAAWSGLAVPNRPWGFLDVEARRRYFYGSQAIFSRIFPSDKESAGHLRVTNRVYTADEWEAQLMDSYRDRASPKFAEYIHHSREVIERREFFERECYLYARLGSRGGHTGLSGKIAKLAETVMVGAGMDDAQPNEEERRFWSDQATSVVDTLSTSWLAAEPIHRRRLEWMTRHNDTPGLPTPDTAPADETEWGAGEWRTVLASYTQQEFLGVSGKDRFSCVKFDAPTGDGVAYAAYLPLSIIPNNIHYERNWIHHASSLDFPVDVDVHFEIIDPERAEKELDRPITAAEAQEDEDREAGARVDDTTALQQQGLREAKTRVQMNREYITYWQAVFCVYDTSKEELLSKVTKLIKHYKDIQFELVCPKWDQRELFYQSFPGAEVMVDDWIHRTDPAYLASAQPWLTSTVGDRDDSHGLYQGHTIVRDANGIPQKGVPVFYDLQNVVDEEGKAPTEVVCGFPGSGKSVSRGLKVAHEDALRGITQFVWDPKGDFLPLKAYAAKMHLNPDKVKLVDLYDANASVSLDPFGIAEVNPDRNIDERETSATDILNSLCFEQVQSPEGLSYRQIISNAVSAVLRHEASTGAPATMAGVLDVMKQFALGDFSALAADLRERRQDTFIDSAQMLVEHLEAIRKDTLGKLLFRDPSESGALKVTPGDLVIFIAIKMNPTEPGQTPTRKTVISDVISGLMTDFIRSLLFILPDQEPKAAIFDEWHVIKKTPRASALLDWLRRMGRSKRCMVRQMSQSALDFDNSSLSTVWCGYTENEDEARASCKLLGIEGSAANINLIMGLRAGQFLFRDAHKRVAHVQVDIWDDWLLEKFNTSAKAKERIASQLAAKGEIASEAVPA